MCAAAMWWNQAVFYEIYIRSFQDSNDDGIGDLNGITSRLDYLQDLGVNALWITPFYPSPQVDFGYDVADHENVDPLFGTLADFDRLVSEAHRREIRIAMTPRSIRRSDHLGQTGSRRSASRRRRRRWAPRRR